MRLELAYLADFATNYADGRWTVVGADLRKIEAEQFPLEYPSLYFVLRFAFAPSEGGETHEVRIEVARPGGSVLLQPVRLEVKPQPSREEQVVQAACRIVGVSFPDAGAYHFKVSTAGGELLGGTQLEVASSRGLRPQPVSETDKALNDGYEAFAAGDPAKAEAIFKGILAKKPDEPSAHNNLGFLMMARGLWSEALASFVKARDLGFTRQELLGVNIGCCDYQLGRFSKSLEMFQFCLTRLGYNGSAVLVALGSTPRPIDLSSAGDYTALLDLNAGWAALKSGKTHLTERYLAGALASELAGGQDHRNDDFATAVAELQAALGDASSAP